MGAPNRFKLVGFALFTSAALMAGLGLWFGSASSPLADDVRGFVLAAFLIAAVGDIVIGIVMLRRGAAHPNGRM